MEQTLKSYRTVITLSDGAQVVLRPLQQDDDERLMDMFQQVSQEDLNFFRNDVQDRELLNKWMAEMNYDKVFPLVAVVGDRFVGEATLHFLAGPYRHLAEVRIFLTKGFRRRGLGTAMLKTMVQLARRVGRHQLIAEIPVEQSNAIKAFKGVGFEARFTREDYFMTPDGITHDVTVLTLRLVKPTGEF